MAAVLMKRRRELAVGCGGDEERGRGRRVMLYR
jgi:hypothetical protein